MYTTDEYNNLTSKYGPYASWAIWDYENAGDTTVIDQNSNQLHSKFVLLGLNISRLLGKPSWSNFHDNSFARRLNYACNDTKLRGSYMTDLFKDVPEPKAVNLKNYLTDKLINKNVRFFDKEMSDVKVRSSSKFVIFGALAAEYFNRYFKINHKNQVIYCRHYSYPACKDKEWVSRFWKNLNINQNYDLTIKKYK